MTHILARLREPSSYAGLAVLLGLFGVRVAPETMEVAVQVATGAAGLAAILMRERPR